MNPLQRAAMRRKVAYFAAILALFTISIFYRGLEAKTPDGASSYVWVPLSGDDRTAGSLARKTIVSQAQRLELRELDEGEPDLTGEAVRLASTGLRGFAVTAIWYNAIEEQKRNDFHKFEKSIKAVTMLQPHFITPWVFQSWNVAYNVSVEMHSLGDMYFYIARGIELLAEGERRNRRSPDMRYHIAFYYQNKFGVADQVLTLRCLYQLSCIPPDERNPVNLMSADETVNPETFKKFCMDHPMLVRRLRGAERPKSKDLAPTSDTLRMQEPIDVVRFLRENYKVPSRYKNATELNPPDRQFPVLPPEFNEGPGEANPRSSAADLGERFSGFLAAKAWFTYANVLVPSNPRDEANNPIPSGPPSDYDPFKYRMPRSPALILFKQGPPRAQTYQGEMMHKEGWFDEEGWEADAGVSESNAWFVETVGGQKRKPKDPVILGAGVRWSQIEWQKAYNAWDKHGVENGLSLRPNQLNQLRINAGLPAGSELTSLPPMPTAEQMANEAFARRQRAQEALYFYQSNRALTNFAYYLAVAQGEQQKETIDARKMIWKAAQEQRLGNMQEAAKLYKEGLGMWRGVLARNPNFHRTERLQTIEEQTYETELDYLRLLRDDDPFHNVRSKALEDYIAAYNDTLKKAAAVIPFGAPGPSPKVIPEPLRSYWYFDTAEKYYSPFAGTITAHDVPPGDPRIGTLWIETYIKENALTRPGIRKPTAPPLPGSQASGQ